MVDMLFIELQWIPDIRISHIVTGGFPAKVVSSRISQNIFFSSYDGK